MEKTVITIVGKDTTGIIAKSSTWLYQHNVNILDIAQTIVGGIFNMMMIVDTANMTVSYEELVSNMKALAEEIGVDIRCQKEEIFDMMHRI
ncbi:MAG: ACT domain-containing protein [Bacteroidales bacterium]|nr:ACT domain-containing protein [Bacteroidales bacterium]